MDKAQAIGLLNDIVASCRSLDVSGFYTSPLHALPTEVVELRLIASLDADSRKQIRSMISPRGLKMAEDKGLVIIFEPKVVDVNI